ncbi:CdaR family protein [Fusicatenibacter sp.]
MKKKILEKLLNNLSLKILSILIAIVIWYVVVSVNDPIVKERFEVPVQVTNEAYIAAGKKTYQIAEEYQTVIVTVTDNNSVVSRLKASDITVTADLTQIVTMDTNPVYVPLKATCPMVKQEKLSTVTTTIPVEIEDVDSAKFPITIDAGNTKPAKDYEVGTMTSDPENVTISGPASLINKISSVVAKVDVTNMRKSGIVTADLVIIDKNQDEMPESQMEFLNFDSGTPQVNVDIELWRRVSGIKINALYSGTPADGYQIKNIYTTPEEITVAGSEEALKQLADQGNTIEIPEDYTSVEGQRSDVETTVDLSEVLANETELKISSSSSASVTVHVTVMPNESREFQLDVDQIQTSNLQSSYTVLYDQTQIAIRIKASDKNLAKLDMSQVTAAVDLNGMGVGDYEVPVKITLPDGYELVDSVKTTIHIKEKAVANKTSGTN